MATKNLAKTVIEPGRTSRSKYARQCLRRRDRREAKHFCYNALTLLDFEELGATPRRGRKGYSFDQDDKIGPAMKWLFSKIGQPWDDVFSELSTKFRQRGIALSHVVDEHMLDWVEIKETHKRFTLHYFKVDDNGILQTGERWQEKKFSWAKPKPKYDRENVQDWADNRRVVIHSDHCYWTKPDLNFSSFIGSYFVSHRQADEFSEKDYEIWKTLSEFRQKDLIHYKGQ